MSTTVAPPGGHSGGLHIPHRSGGQRAEIVDAFEDFADDVEGRCVVRAAHAEEDTHCFAGLGLERLFLGQRKGGAVENEILGSLCQQPVVAFGELAFAAELLLGVDLALHDVEFAIDRWQSS